MTDRQDSVAAAECLDSGSSTSERTCGKLSDLLIYDTFRPQKTKFKTNLRKLKS